MSIRFVRYRSPKFTEPAYGVLANDMVVPLDASREAAGIKEAEPEPLETVTLLPPVEPTKIVCVGLNYQAHVEASHSADEAPERPLIFLKPPSAVIGPGEKIIHPPESQRVDYEAELGVVIARTARHVSAEKAEEYIFGFTCVNDVTARDLQKSDGQWSRAKGYDTFCPVGPWIVPHLDWRDVLVEGIHNDEVKQSGRTSQMIFDVPVLISYISSIMTLNPGDLIATGTPSGIAPMKPGDRIEVRIEGIGSLENQMA
jgi:2-keto-4-pentenoate hydratase/2-oxohepta-3-ene-1,7-dioic acid hydratase in catechol pathway